MPPRRERADKVLVERRLAASRSQAQGFILAGKVYVGTERVDKAGSLLAPDADIFVRPEARFVSRGGLKLEGALHALGVSAADRVCADIGASTGGFTDCLLAHGARAVYAIDVGRGQLHSRLRADPRVRVMEGVNARHLQREQFGESIDLVVVDASFISLEKLLPAVASILPAGGELLALVKPQFEAGRAEADRGRGVIRDPEVRSAAIDRVCRATALLGFRILGQCDCCLPGPKGNLEHFIWAERVPDRAR